MNKTSKKFLGYLMTAAIAATIVVPVHSRAASLTISQIYANAFNATKKAMTDKTQKSVNDARALVALIPKEYFWARGEFSKQLDKIQHPIFVRAYNAILEAQAIPTQARVNAARAAIDSDMPVYYRRSYSQALDIVQQRLMKYAKDAYEKAKSTKTSMDIDMADAYILDLKTSQNTQVVNWATTLYNQFVSDLYTYMSELNSGTAHTKDYTISSIGTGSYGSANPASPTEVTGDVAVNIPSATEGMTLKLQNINIDGNLTIDFGSGDVVLENVNVTGLIVKNVGSNSLHLTGNSYVDNLTVQDSNNDARIVVEDNAIVDVTVVNSGAVLRVAKEGDYTQAFNQVNVEPASKQNIVLDGLFNDVNVLKDSKVTLNASSVVKNTVTILAPVELSVASTASVAAVNVATENAADKIVLNGSLNNVTVNAACEILVESGNVTLSSTLQDKVKVTVSEAASVQVDDLAKYTTDGSGSATKIYYPMTISSNVPKFITGKQAEFTVTTSANDDSGKMVRAYFTLPEGANVEYYEVQNGNWYPLTNVYGPETGFPVSDATSRFRATFANAGTQTIKVDFKDLNGNVIASKDIAAEVRAYVPMEVTSNVPTFNLGEQKEFTVSTKANDDSEKMVRAYFTLPEGANVEYYEVQNGNWYPLSNVYGPESGFPLSDATSRFRAAFTEDGVKTIKVDFKDLDGNVVGTKDITAEVQVTDLANNPMLAVWDVNASDPFVQGDITYPAGSILQYNVNFKSGYTLGDFSSAEVDFYVGAEKVGTNSVKAAAITENASSTGLTGLISAGPNAADADADPFWNIGAYTSDQKPTKAVFRLTKQGITYTAEADLK